MLVAAATYGQHASSAHMSTEAILTLVLAAIGTAVALATLIRALIEYREQGKQKRAADFLDLRYRFVESESFRKIADLIDLATVPETAAHSSKTLAELPLSEKRRYVGFFENVALAVNSSLISAEVADYMFGYYARACWDSHPFWSGEISKANPYWMLFATFCRDMQAQRERFEENCADDDYMHKTYRF